MNFKNHNFGGIDPSESGIYPDEIGVQKMPKSERYDSQEHRRQLGEDDECLRQQLEQDGSLICEYNNWLVSTKSVAPYSKEDFMLMLKTSQSQTEAGFEELAPQDAHDVLAATEAIRDFTMKKSDTDKIIIGLNRGPGQSIKRVHLHVTNISEIQFQPLHEIADLESFLLEKVAVSECMMHANRELHDRLSTIDNRNWRYDHNSLATRLESDLGSNANFLQQVSQVAEQLRHDLSDSGSEWGYSWSIDQDNLFRIGMNDKATGILELNKIILERRADIPNHQTTDAERIQEIKDDLMALYYAEAAQED